LVSFAAFLFANTILNKILGLKDFEVMIFAANKGYKQINVGYQEWLLFVEMSPENL
jgi:hypothetical protein